GARRERLPRRPGGRQGISGRLDRRILAGVGDQAGDPVEGERGPLGATVGVRQGCLPPSEYRGVPDRLAEGVPPGVLTVREDGQEFRWHDQDGVYPTLPTS